MQNAEEKKDDAPPDPAVAVSVVVPAPFPLKHFLGFEPQELKNLQAQYNKTIPELEAIIDSHPWLDRYSYASYWIGNFGSCTLFLVFPIITSNQGIQTIGKIISSSINISNAVGYAIGAPGSVIEVLQYMFLFSPRKKGKEFTLLLDSLQYLPQKTQEAYAFSRASPLHALSYASQFIFNRSLLLICNLTGTMSELIYVPLNYATWYARAFTVATLYSGLFYFSGFTNQNYYDGLDFFKDTKRPGLLSLIRDYDITTPLQIVLQAASSVGLRTFPLYYYFAVSSEELLGWWFWNNYFVAALTVVQGTCMLYSSTFDFYMKDYEKLKAHFTESPNALPNLQTFNKEYLQQHGYLDIFKKEPGTAILIGIRAFLGAYFGYSTATQFIAAGTARLAAQITCTTIGGLSFGAILFSAELKRFLRHEHVKILGLETIIIPETPEPEKNKWSTYTATFINNVGSFVGAMSTVGTVQPLIGDGVPELTAIITLLAIEQMINTILFRQDKVEDTVQDITRSLKKYYGRFFPSVPAPEAVLIDVPLQVVIEQQVVDAEEEQEQRSSPALS